MPDLAETGVECDGELLVKRVVSRGGRTGSSWAAAFPPSPSSPISPAQLINIYGQHESQTLLKTDNHLRLLDDFGGVGRGGRGFAAIFEEYRKTAAEVRRIEEGEREAARRIDLLSFQSDEIGKVSPAADEEEDLHQERQLLAHGEKLQRNSREAFELLYGSDAALLGGLRRVVSSDCRDRAGSTPRLRRTCRR